MSDTPEAASLSDTRSRFHSGRGAVVVASPDSIPEAVFSIPAVRALRAEQPRTTFVVVAPSVVAPLWRKVDAVDQVIEFAPSDSHRKVARSLAAAGLDFEVSLAWEDGPAARAFAKREIPRRFGLPAEKLAKSLTDPVPVVREAGPIEHRVRHYLLFARELGADPFQASHFHPPSRPPASPDPLVAIAPGSDFGSAAEWPLDRFEQLATELTRDHQLVVLTSPDRPGPANSLARALDLEVRDLAGEELIDFLATCRALVANDSSLPHLASFVGTPSLVLFGPNEPEWRRPLGRIHQVVREHVPCSGCLLHKCPLDHRCMTGLSVPQVRHAFDRLVAGS